MDKLLWIKKRLHSATTQKIDSQLPQRFKVHWSALQKLLQFLNPWIFGVLNSEIVGRVFSYDRSLILPGTTGLLLKIEITFFSKYRSTHDWYHLFHFKLIGEVSTLNSVEQRARGKKRLLILARPNISRSRAHRIRQSTFVRFKKLSCPRILKPWNCESVRRVPGCKLWSADNDFSRLFLSSFIFFFLFFKLCFWLLQFLIFLARTFKRVTKNSVLSLFFSNVSSKYIFNYKKLQASFDNNCFYGGGGMYGIRKKKRSLDNLSENIYFPVFFP